MGEQPSSNTTFGRIAAIVAIFFLFGIIYLPNDFQSPMLLAAAIILILLSLAVSIFAVVMRTVRESQYER